MGDSFPLLDRRVCQIKPAAERNVKKGHPWIYENSIQKLDPNAKTGDLAIIFDKKKNKFLAAGLIDFDSPIRIKVLVANKSATIDYDWLNNKVLKAFQRRADLLQTDTNSYRLIYGENDGLPGLIIDIYAQVAVVKLYSAIWFPWLESIKSVLLDLLDTVTIVLRLSRNVEVKHKSNRWYNGAILHGSLIKEDVIFKEHGLLFSANVIKGHKTGYFLDHRNNRLKVGQMSKGKSVIDIFSYAGGFTVHALAGGANSVVSLDISRQAQEMAKANVELNNLTQGHSVIVADAFEGMSKLNSQKRKFDIVVIDPPSFAKKLSEVESAKRTYRRLLHLAVRLVAKKGILVAASCSSRVSSDDFFEMVQIEIERENRVFELLSKTFHDIDHPEGIPELQYLKCSYWKLD